MNKELYWKVLKVLNTIRFFFISKIYKTNEKWSVQKDVSYSTRFVIKEIIKRLFVGLIFLVPIVIINNVVISKYPFFLDVQTKQYLLDFMYAGLGIVGVILGLYCANISSVYASIYTNAPIKLSELFASDIISNKSIAQITGYLIFDLLTIFGVIIDIIEPGIVLIVAIIFATIYIIVAFSINGNRSLRLSNTFTIADLVYSRINHILKSLSKNKLYYNDSNIQNHLRKISSNGLERLREISGFNINIPPQQDTYMCDFLCKNIYLMNIYQEIKPNLSRESFWFEEKEEYRQWYNASYSEITNALDTGTMIRNERTKNYSWFEDRLFSINILCINKFINDSKYDCLYKYLLLLSESSKYYIVNNDVNLYVNHIITIFDLLNNKIQKRKASDNNEITGIFELLIICYMDITINLRKLVAEIDIAKIKEEYLKDIIGKRNNNKYNLFFNNIKLQKLKKCLETELKIEKKIITADWYIEQFISEAIHSILGDSISALFKYIGYIDKELVLLQDHEMNEAACLSFSKIPELKSKSDILINDFSDVFNELLAKHKEKTIVWKTVPFEEYKKQVSALYYTLPKRFRDVVTKVAVDKWSNRKSVPDYLGYYYNIICTIIVETIANNNFDEFKSAYDGFLPLVLLYQEYIRYDLVKIKEPHLQSGVLQAFAQPMLEYSILSGLAILFGEFAKDSRWKECVNLSIEEFVSKTPKSKEAIEKWAELLKQLQKIFVGIGNRDVLHTSWEMLITESIKKNNFVEYVDAGFGNVEIKSDSNIINSFCRTSFEWRGLSNTEEVFCVVCLNKYLDEDKKYHSRFNWENNLNEE